MTIRSEKLQLVPLELLGRRLRKDPSCPVTRSELIRRGKGDLVFETARAAAQIAGQIATDEQFERSLERAHGLRI